MSNFTYGTIDGLLSIIKADNVFTGGLFTPTILLVLLIIQLATFTYAGIKSAAIVALANTMLISVFMVASGLLGIQYALMILAALVAAVIWAYFTGDR